jgi:hypothetical protein
MMFRIVFWDVLPCKIIIVILHGSASQKKILNVLLCDIKIQITKYRYIKGNSHYYDAF